MHLDPVGQPTVPQHVPQRPGGTGLGLPAAEDHPVDPCRADGAGTHGARFDGDGQRAAREVPAIQRHGGGTQGDDQGVRDPDQVLVGVGPVGERRIVAGRAAAPPTGRIARPGHVFRRQTRSGLFQHRGELVAEAAPLRDHRQLFVGVQVDLVDDQLHLLLADAQIGQQGQVALRPRVVVDVVVLRNRHLQEIEHVGGDVVVEAGGRVGEQQRCTAGNRPDDDEEFVVHRHHAEDRAGRRHPAQRGDHAVQVVQEFQGQQRAPPGGFFSRDSDTEPLGRGSAPGAHEWQRYGLRVASATQYPPSGPGDPNVDIHAARTVGAGHIRGGWWSGGTTAADVSDDDERMHPTAPPPSPLSAEIALPSALCVLGLGLIGGSLVRAAGPHLPVFGWSRSEDTRRAAAGDGCDVSDTVEAALTRATETDALVVLASPVTAFPGLLRAIDETAPTVRLTDVAGVKASVEDAVAALAPRTRFIGSHPMAGTTASGWHAGSADLFAGAAWVTCLTDDSAVDDWVLVAALALTVGSRVIPADPSAHDAAVARISHLPHLLALALAQVGQAGGSLALALAASSFADGTRVAGTRPELVRAMCETNREELIGALDDALGLLGVARGFWVSFRPWG